MTTGIPTPRGGPLIPAVQPRGMRAAISEALSNEDHEFAETRWSDAQSSVGRSQSWGGVKLDSRHVDSRKIAVDCRPANAFRPIERIGGSTDFLRLSTQRSTTSQALLRTRSLEPHTRGSITHGHVNETALGEPCDSAADWQPHAIN